MGRLRGGAAGALVPLALRRIGATTHWHQVLLFVARRLGSVGRMREVAYLAEEIFSERGREAARIVLGAALLAELGRERVERLGPRQQKLWRDAVRKLKEVVEHGDASWRALTPEERVAAGRLLAQLGDERALICEQRVLWSVPFEAETYEIQRHKPGVTISPFSIARFPVSAMQFERFLSEASARSEWWIFDGEDIREVLGERTLRLSGTVGEPNQPATSISWYEAVAYCRWITGVARRDGWISADEIIRLPTEAEWMAAAFCDPRGGAWHAWPDQARTLLQKLQPPSLREPLPIGLFPECGAPAGVEDLFLTSFEWCSSSYRAPSTVAQQAYPPSQPGPVYCGSSDGAQFDQPRTSKDAMTPDGSDYRLGFRVVRVAEKLKSD